MRLIIRQKIALIAILVINAILWIIPSNVVEQIANDRHTMLGRYSRTQFAWIIGMTIISLFGLYIDRAVGEQYKRRWFQVMAITIFMIPALILLDFLLRTPGRLHYVRDSLAYHHPPNFDSTKDFVEESLKDFVDKPEAARTYPNATPGYPTIRRTLRTDARGFRNAATLDQADVVTLGDSFTEGSGVSDEHPWPVRLAEQSGWTVCNLGISGYDPLNYLASLKEYGVHLKPKKIICMLYEGNDFRSAISDQERSEPGFLERVSTYMTQSPLLDLLDRGITSVFGSMNSRGPLKGAELLDWMPIRFPPGPDAKSYAFAPKQLRDRMKDADQFSLDLKWLNTRRILVEISETCKAIGAEFYLAYAPTKAHVVMPTVARQLPAERVRAFTAISFKGDLPDAPTFMAALLERIDDTEQVVREYCEREGIHFISTTEALQESIRCGQQAYFTYDQHWTPEGHEVAAKVIWESIMQLHTKEQFATQGSSLRLGANVAARE